MIATSRNRVNAYMTSEAFGNDGDCEEADRVRTADYADYADYSPRRHGEESE